MKFQRLPLLFFLLTTIFYLSCKKDPVVVSKSPFLHFYGAAGDETGRCVKVLGNGDIAVCGYGAGPNGGTDFFLLLTDKDGGQKWIKYFGGNGNETCWSMDLTTDGGFVLGGYTNSFGAGGDDFYIVKTDRDGNVIWTKTYGGLYNDDATNIRTLSNGYFISGIYNSGHDENAWMLRLDNNGDSLWSYNYGGNGGDGAMASCSEVNGGHVVVGYTNSTSTNSTDGFLLLINDSGIQTGYYTYGTNGYEEPHSVVSSLDGNGWVISGHEGTAPTVLTHNVFLRAIGSDGTQRWNYLFGGVEHDGSEGMCVTGNSYAIIARSNSRQGFGEDVYFLEVNADGSLKNENWLGTSSDDAGYGIVADDGSFILTGYSFGGAFGGKDIYLERVVE